MGKTLHLVTRTDGTAIDNNEKLAPSGRLAGLSYTTDPYQQVICRVAGIWSKIAIRINSTGTSRVLRGRKNNADGNQVITIGAGASGWIEDASNTDSVAVGDKWCLSFAEAGTDPTAYIVRNVFDGDGGATVSHFSAGSYTTLSQATTVYRVISGGSLQTDTEANVKQKMRASGTIRGIRVYSDTNFITADSTVRTRKSGGNGNLSVTVTASTSGEFVDSATPDTFAAGDDLNFQLVAGATGSGALMQCFCTVEWSSRLNDAFGATFNSITRAASATAHYVSPIGSPTSWSTTTESQTQAQPSFAMACTRLRAYLETNSYSADATFRFRKNTGDGNQVVTLTASTTGVFEDTEHVDLVAATDVFNASIAGGTSGSILIDWVGMTMSETQAHTGEATFAGAGALSADSTVAAGSTAWAGQATFDGAGSLSALAQTYKLGEATLFGAGSLSALATLQAQAAATLAGAGTLSALATMQAQIAATFAGVGSLSDLSSLSHPALATFAGAGSLAASITAGISCAATFGGVGDMDVSADDFSFMSPDADAADGTWTTHLGGSDLFSAIDEMVVDDTDYIRSAGAPASDTCKIGLSDPSTGAGQPLTVMYRYRKEGAGQIDLGVRLLQGTTEIAAWTHTNISTGFLTAEQTLTAPQFAAITDFNNLFVELTANAP